MPRIGTGFDPEAPAAQKVLTELGLPGFTQARAGVDGSATAGPLLVAASSLPISASEIRRRAREGRSLAYRMPDASSAISASTICTVRSTDERS